MTDGPTRAGAAGGAGAPGAAGAAGPRLLALLDYDGTMTTHECNEIALQPLVGDPWWDLEEESYNDRMSHAEVFDRQIGLIEAPRAELIRRLLEVAEPMPGLRAFFTELRARGGESAIVSAGIREAIEAFWEREQLPPMELFASELVGEGPDDGPPYHLEFSDALGDCPRCGPKSCKAGDPTPSAPPRRRRPRVRRRAQRRVPCARGRPGVRARLPGQALCTGEARVAPAHRLRRGAGRGRRVAGAPVSAGARQAQPALLGPVSRPASETALIVVAAVVFQAVVWAFLLWLLRASGPWHHFSEYRVLRPERALVPLLGVQLLRRLRHRRLLRLRAEGRPGTARLQGLLVRIPAAGAAAAHAAAARRRVELVPALVRRGDDPPDLRGRCSHRRHGCVPVARPATPARGRGRLRRGRPRRRGDHRQPLRRGGGAHARRLPVLPGAAPHHRGRARRSASASPSSSRRACCSRWCSSSPRPAGASLYALAGFLVFAIVPFLPFLGRFDGLTNIITYHAQRPLQIESVPGTLYLIAGAKGAWGIGTGNSFGSQSLAGPGSAARRPALHLGRAAARGRRLRADLAPPRAAAGGARVHPGGGAGLRARLHRLQQGALAAVPLLDAPAGRAGRGRQDRPGSVWPAS